MDDSDCHQFFSHPSQTYHRQYEALRAVFVDGRSQKDVAEEFAYEYNSFRQLVCQFRRVCNTDLSDGDSPFFEASQRDEPTTNPIFLNLKKLIVDS